MVYRRVHMVGIGGVGMAAIARVLLEMGVRVSGSDLASNEYTADLAERGVRVAIGHRAENIGDADLVVVSTAIPPDNVEIAAARQAGIPVWHRSEMLAEIMNAKVGIAVAGAHGKTTITSMLSWVLHQSGRQPTFAIGGYLPGLGGARYGTGPFVVAEADESDRSFLRYRPHYAVVTSIEADHLEYYQESFANMVRTFEQFLQNIPPHGTAVLCRHDAHLREIAPRLSCQVVWYGLSADCEYRAGKRESLGFRTTFEAYEGDTLLGTVTLQVPGEHNILNSLATIAVCRRLGLVHAEIAPHLATFRGAKRRFEVVGSGEVLVVDDYAHHPSEIRAVLNGPRRGWPDRRIVAVFQPHRYTRTHFLMDEFAAAFAQADRVVLTEVYAPPPEQPISGVSGERLAQLVQANEPDKQVDYISQLADVPDHLLQVVQPGDIVITMGAGDIWKASRELWRRVGAQ